jgi:hypothetical protein
MKVELLSHEPKNFKPITFTVTVHTQEEAMAFWHLGNMSDLVFKNAVKNCTVSGHIPFTHCFKTFYHLMNDVIKVDSLR